MTFANNVKPSITKGGVESISIFDVEEIISVQYNKANNTLFNLKLRENSNKIEIHLSRGNAQYKEISECKAGMLWVEHILTFTLDGIISEVSSDVKKLQMSNQNGVAAIVKMKNRTSFLVGYSTKLMSESALKFKNVELNSAIMMYDSPSETWKLTSIDGENAKVLVSTIQ